MTTICKGVVFIDKTRGFGYVHDVLIHNPLSPFAVTLIDRYSTIGVATKYTKSEIDEMCTVPADDDTKSDIVSRGFYVKNHINGSSSVRLRDTLLIIDCSSGNVVELVGKLIYKRTNWFTIMLYGTYKLHVDKKGVREVWNLRTLGGWSKHLHIVNLLRVSHNDVLGSVSVVK